MYLYTLENERFIVALVNCKWKDGEGVGFNGEIAPGPWEITRAHKFE